MSIGPSRYLPAGHLIAAKTHVHNEQQESKVDSCFEELLLLNAKERDGEYRETKHLFSNDVHLYTHVRRRAKPTGEVQGTLRKYGETVRCDK